jgi:Type II secretory pathway, pseudopilin PulG
VQRESPLSIPQAFDPNVSTPSAQNRACRGGRAGCKILPSAGGTPATTAAFSLVELLVVIAIIIILAGLILSTVSYVRNKGARARAETEIAAMSAACESYKADNGIYPRIASTDTLDAKMSGDPTAAAYRNASLVLYRALSGDRNLDRTISATDQNFNIDGTTLIPPLTTLPKAYFAFRPNQLSPTDQTQAVEFIRDPFGNSYGYSTANQGAPANGYNPTFDLWSTAGLTTSPPTGTITPQWIKNW